MGLVPRVSGGLEVTFHHLGEATDKRRKLVYCKGSCLFDGLGPRKEVSDGIKTFQNRVFDSDQTGGVEAHEVLQLALDLVSSGYDAPLSLAKQVPNGPRFRETLQGVLVAQVLQFAPQPFQLLCKLEKSRLSHSRTF